MSDTILKELLKEYSKKKIKVEQEAQEKKEKFYKSHSEFEKIDEKINRLAFLQMNTILKSGISNNNINFEEELNYLKKEKQRLLKELNIPDNFFEPVYECNICKDTGFVSKGNKSNLCNCIQQKIFNIQYNKCNISNLEKENFKTFELSVYSDEINEEKFKSNISPRENIQNIRNIALDFIKTIDDPSAKNLIFIGNTGLGKTFLSNCIANEVLALGKTVLYQTAPTMLDSIIDYRFGKTSNAIYENILNTDLLIIDDLGTEYMNSLKFAELFNIINSRILYQNNHCTKTIISTNLNLQNLFSTYDERIVSRIVGYYNICRFFGDDIRFKKK